MLNLVVLSTDTSYHLAVKTGDMALAGTDANVYFQLIGDEGETEKIQLRQGGKAEKRFEKGRVDKFIVETVDVGKVQLHLKNDSTNRRGKVPVTYNFCFFWAKLVKGRIMRSTG